MESHRVGTANIDVVDAKRKQLVWEALAEGQLDEKAMADPPAAIRAIVRKMFADFPGKAGK
jgi:hypothetical protein